MSADLLREAAASLRESSTTGTYGDPCGECGTTGAFTDAVADWLTSVAGAVEYDHPINDTDRAHALAVARAYLGEQQ